MQMDMICKNYWLFYIIHNSRLDKSLKAVFCWGVVQEGDGVGQNVFQGNLLNLEEPCLGRGLGTGQHIPGMVGDGVVLTIEPCEHAKEREHAEVQEGLKREAVTKKPDHTFWCS